MTHRHSMPPVRHNTVSLPDPQATAHHARVQALIDRPQEQSTGQHPHQSPPVQGQKNANAERYEPK